MNIKEAKEQIKVALRAYFTKDNFGNYRIPIEKQRPIFLMGPPGIGKTAIMEQVASELGVGLISYSMTHHTRQSAIGLPFISHKNFGGKEYAVSEYTMSEIIASVYELTESTGFSEGILFLDEINCVSETLAPSMLQFLQYKVFGNHKLPDGWLVVTAGNPPEYNNSVREFDIVTWDRLKRMDIEPDYKVWKEYAYTRYTHPAVLTYLDIKKSDFYLIESTVDGKSFVTARGWSDLSDMIILCEENGDTVSEVLVSQYLQNRRIAKDFAVYYDLFKKYKSDYQVDKILDGKADNIIKDRATKAKFDERISLLGLLLDGVSEYINEVCARENATSELLEALKKIRQKLNAKGDNIDKLINEQVNSLNKKIKNGKVASNISVDKERSLITASLTLKEMSASLKKESLCSDKETFTIIKKDYDLRTSELNKEAQETKKKLSNLFAFLDEVFGEGQEILIIVTELTINPKSARFISRYGCDEYFAHNRELLFYERQKELITELEDLDL